MAGIVPEGLQYDNGDYDSKMNEEKKEGENRVANNHKMPKRSGSANQEDSDERASKRVCGCVQCYRLGNDDSDGEHVSVHQHKTPSEGEGADADSVQRMASAELVNDTDEPSKHIAQNPNPNSCPTASESEYTAWRKALFKICFPSDARKAFALRAMNVRSSVSGNEATEKASDDISISRAMSVGSIDSKKNIGCSLEVDDVPRNSPSLDPIRTPSAITWSHPETIKVTEDTSLVLVPRIKLNFVLGCTSGDVRWLLVESNVKRCVTRSFRDPIVFPKKPLIIPKNDVHFRYVAEPKWTDEHNMFVVAEGCLFVRNLKLPDKKALLFVRDFLLQNMSTYDYNYSNSWYKLRLSLPLEEDAEKMMASISKTLTDNTGPSQELPTIMMRGLPFQWFAEQPDTSRPSKQLLLNFFKNFGSVRNLDVVEDGVSIQFENCNKALQLLCSFSLQKVGSNEMADYAIIWKDREVCFDARKEASSEPIFFRFRRALNGRSFVSPPMKKEVLRQKAKALDSDASNLEASMDAFKIRVREFAEELNRLAGTI